MMLDEYQRSAVAVRHNVVVSAGAGSGKTRVLTERFVDLIVSGARISEILALTFTRKAATEMFGRIHAALLDRADAHPELKAQLAVFDEAQISTIDSFCASILRDGATGLGLPPVFEVGGSGAMRTRAIQVARFLERHSEHLVLSRFVRHYGVDRVGEQLLLPLLDRFFRLSDPIDFPVLAERQTAWLKKRLGRVEQTIAATLELARSATPSGEYLVQAHERLVEAGDDYDAIRGVIADLNYAKGKRDESSQEFKTALQELSWPSKRSGLLVERDQYLRTLTEMEERKSLYLLFADWQEEVLEERRRTGVLGYQEVMELAVDALVRFPDLLESYRRRFRYIMIDEFQDNNRTQRDLLFLLAGDPARCGIGIPQPDRLHPGKLFFVGDQKQSIYRFRGADVRVFKRLSDEISRTIPLRYNYRSEPGLIEFFNRFFPRVFAGSKAEYEADFEPLLHRDERNDERCAITIARAPVNPTDGEYASNVFAEADWIASEIERLIDECGYTGDRIAILLRTSANQQKYERMLRRRGIPYQTQVLRALFLEAPAADLYALLQLHFHPDDRHAYATVLRSPFVMVSDEGMWRVLKSNARDPFAPVEGVSEEDRTRLAAGRDLYETLDRRIDRTPLSIVLEELWEESGYRHMILSRGSDHGYLEHFDYLVTIAQTYEERPAIEFVDFLRAQLGQSEKIDDFDPPKRPGTVQIMTIHKSKGLEFPVVFVADCDSRQSADRSVITMHEELGLTIAIPPVGPRDTGTNVFVKYAGDEERLQEVAERKRLLYVAATRAEERLYLTASLRDRKRERGASFWELISSAVGLSETTSEIDAEFTECITVHEIEPLPEMRLRDRVRGARRRTRAEFVHISECVEVVDFAPVEIESTPTAINRALLIARGLIPSETDAEIPDARSGTHTARETALTLGTLTHRLIELRARDGMTRDRWISVPIEIEALIADGEEALLDEAWELSERFIASELWSRIGTRTRHFELPFVYGLDIDGVTRYVRGQIDLLTVAPDHTWLVDFKTDRTFVPEHYDGQMAVYRAAAEALFDRPATLSLFSLRESRAVSRSPVLSTVVAEITRSETARKYLGWDLPSESSLM